MELLYILLGSFILVSYVNVMYDKDNITVEEEIIKRKKIRDKYKKESQLK